MVKKLLSLIKNKKAIVVFILFLVILLIPLRPAHAILGLDSVWSALKTLPMGMALYVGNIIAGTTALIASFSGLLLWLITSGKIINTGYVYNPLVKTGLDITQSIANIFLVLVLVFIAIAVILRLEGYETKKILPRFILIALLVNFAPVFCGLIIDASNILMSIFLYKTAPFSTLTHNVDIFKQISSSIVWTNIDIADVPAVFFEFMALAFTNIVLFIAFLGFALVFLGRYFALWILVILSPLAFVAFITPATNSFWNEWWKQFVNWCFVGAVAGFFLYLSQQLFVMLPNNLLLPSDISLGSSAGNIDKGVVASIMMALTPAIFAVIGLIYSLSLSAMWANKLMSAGITSGKWIGKKGWNKIQSTVKENVPEGIKNIGGRLATRPRWGEGEKGLSGFAKRAINAPYYYARRGVGSIVSTEVTEGQKENIQKSQESMKGKEAATMLSAYHKATTEAEKIGILNAAIAERKLNEMMDTAKHGSSAITDMELQNKIDVAKKWNAHGTIQKAVPHLTTPTGDIKVVVKSLKTGDYGKLSKNAVDRSSARSIETVRQIVLNATEKQVAAMLDPDALGRDGAQAIEDQIKQDTSIYNAAHPGATITTKEWLKANNPNLYRYFTTGPASGLISW